MESGIFIFLMRSGGKFLIISATDFKFLRKLLIFEQCIYGGVTSHIEKNRLVMDSMADVLEFKDIFLLRFLSHSILGQFRCNDHHTLKIEHTIQIFEKRIGKK